MSRGDTRTARPATVLAGELAQLDVLLVLRQRHQPAHRGQFAQFEYDFYTGLTKQHDLAHPAT